MSAADEFPLLCEPCLGNNPFVRMVRDPAGKSCRICDRPVDVFRWRHSGGTKDTQICRICARLRHVCQCCMLDLQLHVSAQIRDSVVQNLQKLPESRVGRTFQQDLFERKIDLGQTSEAVVPKFAQVNTMVERLAEKNLKSDDLWSKICPFFVKSSCNRNAEECGLKHEKPEELGMQLFPPPPEDKTLKVVYIGNLDLDITETDLSGVFAKFGPVESLRIIPKKLIGFVEYTHRTDAEAAVRYLWGNLVVKGQQIRVNWAKSKTPFGVAPKEEASSVGQKRKAAETSVPPPVQKPLAIVEKAAKSKPMLPPGIKLNNNEQDGGESTKRPKLVLKTKNIDLL